MPERAPRKAKRHGGGRTGGGGRSDGRQPHRGAGRANPSPLPLFLAVAALALVVRLIYLSGAAQSPLYLHPALDGRVNDEQAWAVASGAGDRVKDVGDHASEPQPYFRPPGYAYFLAGVYTVAGHDLRAPRVAQAILGALSVLLLGLLGAAIWDARVGSVAAFLGALYAPAIYFDGELVSASLELFLGLLSLWLLVKADHRRSLPRLGAAGLAFGAAAVTRPTILPFAVVAIAWLLLKRVPKPKVAVFAGALLALPMACTVRNAVVAHDPVFIASQGGINFYIGNHAGADGTTPNVPGLGSGVTATYEEPFREASRQVGRPLRASEASAFWFAKGAEFWRRDPGSATALFMKKLAMVWNRRELPNTQDQAFFAPYDSPLFRWPSPFTFAFLAPVALVAAWYERKRAGLLALYAASLSLITAAFFVCDRFRLPLLGFVAPLAAAGLVRAWDAREAALTPRLIPAALLLVAFAFVGIPFPGWQRVETGMSWLRLATAYEQAGDAAAAWRAYQRAEAAKLATPDFYNNYGLYSLRQGDLAGAETRLKRALSIAPGHGPALANLASVYMQEGKWGPSADAYVAAANAIPERAPELLTNAGAIYERAGQIDRARDAYQRALGSRPGFEAAASALRLLDRH